MDQKLLDEIGFVFLGGDGKPYWMRLQGGDPWIYYWHADKRWVSMKRSNQSEIWMANERKMSDSDAKIYHDLNAENSK